MEMRGQRKVALPIIKCEFKLVTGGRRGCFAVGMVCTKLVQLTPILKTSRGINELEHKADLSYMTVYVQYSTHSALKTDQTHSNSSASAQAALQAAQALAGVSDDKQTVK